MSMSSKFPSKFLVPCRGVASVRTRSSHSNIASRPLDARRPSNTRPSSSIHPSNTIRSSIFSSSIRPFGTLLPFKRMELEIWFDRWQYHCTRDIGESAIKFKSIKDLQNMGIDLSELEFRYGHHTGLPELKKQILKQQYPSTGNIVLHPNENILVTSGGSESIFCFYAALAEEGDDIICEVPNYPSNYGIPEGMKLNVKRYELKYENNFKPDIEEIKSMVSDKTKVISITHPNNPTGSVISEEELRDLAGFCLEKDIILLSDETYRDLYPSGSDTTAGADSSPNSSLSGSSPKLPTPAALINENCCSIASMSKCYGLPGCRVGWIVSKNTKLLQQMLTVREYISITNNTVGEVLSLEMLKRKKKILEKHQQLIMKNKRSIGDWITHHKYLEWVVPEVGVVGFPRFTDEAVEKLKKMNEFEGDGVSGFGSGGVSGGGDGLEKFYVLLADKYKTFVVPGDRMDWEARYFRVGFGGDEEDIIEGTRAFDMALEEVLGEYVGRGVGGSTSS